MSKNKVYSKESVFSIIKHYALSDDLKDTPLMSCHSAVGYWIANEEQLEPTDEIVLLGPNKDEDVIHHSILMRGDDIIGDTERASPQRGIDTSYDTETGEYKTKIFPKGESEVTHQTLMRMSVADFRAQYLGLEGPEPSEEPPEPL